MKKNEVLAIDLSSRSSHVAWARCNEDATKILDIHGYSENYNNNSSIQKEYHKQHSQHSSKLVSSIEYAKQQIQGSYDALSSIIVNIGPGSFTGLRIALSFAQGLRSGLGCDVFGLSSMDMWRFIHPSPCPLLTIQDARSKRFYCKIYEKDFLSIFQKTNATDAKKGLQDIQDISISTLLKHLQEDYQEYDAIYYSGADVNLFETQLSMEDTLEYNSEKNKLQKVFIAPDLKKDASDIPSLDNPSPDKQDELNTAYQLLKFYVRTPKEYLERYSLEANASPIYIRSSV